MMFEAVTITHRAHAKVKAVVPTNKYESNRCHRFSDASSDSSDSPPMLCTAAPATSMACVLIEFNTSTLARICLCRNSTMPRSSVASHMARSAPSADPDKRVCRFAMYVGR